METTAEIIQMSPELASNWLENMAYEGQRRLSDDQIDTYALIMMEGDWGVSDVAVRVLDGRSYLLNGYQRLHAVVRSGVTIPINVTTEAVRSREELAQHYGRFDTHRRRQFRDILPGYDLDEEFGFGVHLQEKVATCAALMVPSFQGTSQDRYLRSNDLRVRFLRDWAEVAHNVIEASGYPMGMRRDRALTRMMTAPFLSIMLVTYKYQPIMAGQFWRNLVEDDGLRAKSPEKALRKLLVEVRPRGMLDYQPISRRIAAAWNAFFEGRDLTTLKVLRHRVGTKTYYDPIKIVGTPYDGKTLIYLYGYRDPKPQVIESDTSIVAAF